MLIALSLLSFSASASLSQQQIHAIQNGWHAPYSQKTIDRVLQQDTLITFDDTPKYTIVNIKTEPASKLHWATFWTLQLLDIYTTNKGMQYDCVTELNPLLPKRPSLFRLTLHKGMFLTPLVLLDKELAFTDAELISGTLITGGVVASNFNVIKNAKRKCNKIR